MNAKTDENVDKSKDEEMKGNNWNKEETGTREEAKSKDNQQKMEEEKVDHSHHEVTA